MAAAVTPSHSRVVTVRNACYRVCWPLERALLEDGGDSSSSIYQIPNTEHMTYRLVRTLVYKRGVGIRETVWVGVWFGKSTSVLVGRGGRQPCNFSSHYPSTHAAPGRMPSCKAHGGQNHAASSSSSSGGASGPRQSA